MRTVAQRIQPSRNNKNFNSKTTTTTKGMSDKPTRGGGSESLSVKDRASMLWGNLREAVTDTTTRVQEMVVHHQNIVTFQKPMCLEGTNCSHASDREHMRTFRHLCPYGHQCASKYDVAHLADFIHDAFIAGSYMPLPADSNRRAAVSSSSTATSGLDFLDEPKKDNKRSASGSGGDGAAGGLAPMRASYGPQEFHMLHYVQKAQWPMMTLYGDDAADAIAEWRARVGAAGDRQQQSPSSASAASQPKSGAGIGDFFTSLFSRGSGSAGAASAGSQSASGAQPLRSDGRASGSDTSLHSDF